MTTIETILTRRSTRSFLNKTVDETILSRIIEAGRYAPSGGNNQTTHLLVIRNKNVLDELAKLVKQEFSKMEITEGMYPSMAGAIRSSKKPVYIFHYNAPVLILTANKKGYGNNMADCACVLENMMIAANELGLGSCWINQIKWLNDNPVIVNTLEKYGLRSDELVLGGLSLGWPDTADGLPNRIPLPRKGNPVTTID